MESTTTKDIVAGTLLGIGIIIGLVVFLGAVIGLPAYTAHENNIKQQKMTELCVAEGHDGWSGAEHNGRLAGCFNR